MVMQQVSVRDRIGTTHDATASPAVPVPRDGLCAAALADIAAGWHAAKDEAGAAGQITRATLIAVAGAVGILRLARGDRLIGQAPTDDTAAELDELQAELHEGPALDALHAGAPMVIDTLARNTRWPLFTGRAAQRGVAAVACLPLRSNGKNLGTLNLYASTPHAFPGDVTPAAAIALHAALALHALAQREHLQRAVASRDQIGQAKGILMVRHHCTAQQASDRLVAAAQAADLELTEVADWLITEQQRRLPAGAGLTGAV